MKPTAVDERRLRDGARASKLPEPMTRDEAQHTLDALWDGVRALQSTDDLGSQEANDAAWKQMLELEARARALRTKWNL